MSIEIDARQEAERRWPIRNERTYGLRNGFEKGAVWASERADREPSDAEVEAAGEAIWGRGWRVPKEVIRAALLAAQEVRS